MLQTKVVSLTDLQSILTLPIWSDVHTEKLSQVIRFLNVSGAYNMAQSQFIPENPRIPTQLTHPIDILMVFGSNDINVPNHAADFLMAHYAEFKQIPIVYISGKRGHPTTPHPPISESQTEADLFHALIQQKLADSVTPLSPEFYLDTSATNSGENVLNACKKIPALTTQSLRIGIIQTPPDLLRAVLTAAQQGNENPNPTQKWHNSQLIALPISNQTIDDTYSTPILRHYLSMYTIRALFALMKYIELSATGPEIYVRQFNISADIIESGLWILRQYTSQFSTITAQNVTGSVLNQIEQFTRVSFEKFDHLYRDLPPPQSS